MEKNEPKENKGKQISAHKGIIKAISNKTSLIGQEKVNEKLMMRILKQEREESKDSKEQHIFWIQRYQETVLKATFILTTGVKNNQKPFS